MMIRLTIVIVVTLSIVGLSGAADADRMKHDTVIVQAEDAEFVDVGIEFGVGEITLVTDDIDEVATIDVYYDPDRTDYQVDYEVRGKTGHFWAETDHHGLDLDSEDNIWEGTLSTQYPMSMEMELGACGADIDLGGLRLETLRMSVGASEARVDFSTPNPTELRRIDIESGAASLEVHNLGNANFRTLTFSGGVGSFDLDLRGRYREDARVDIEVGLGAADIIMPRGIPCRVTTDGENWLSSVNFHHDDLEEITEGVYESPDYRRADVRLMINIEVGLGSVDLTWRD